MTHHHDPHPPYHLPANQYPQLEEERQGTPQDFAQGFPALQDGPDDEVTGTAEDTTLLTGKPGEDVQDGTLGLEQNDEAAVKPAPKQPSSSTSRRRRKKTSDAEAIRALLAARPPTPSMCDPPTPTRSTTPATSARAAALAHVREQAVEQFIAMELRREKERKRKADYRARKRQEAKGVPPAPPGGTEQMEPDTAEVDGTEYAPVDDEGPQFPISSTSLVQHMYQHLQHHSPQPQQSHGIDPQMMGRGEPNSGRASSAPGGLGGGKVQVRVGDRIVAIELEQVEKIIREQQAQQQAQAQALHAAGNESASSTSSASPSPQHPGPSNDPHAGHVTSRDDANGTGAGASDDDRIALEAFMATASRDVPLPNGMHSGMLQGEMLDLGNHAQEHDDDLPSLTLNTATGLTSHLSSYASLSSLASMIGASGQFSLPPGGNGHAPSVGGDLSTGAMPSPREARPITNWFQPILWTMIDETAEKLGFGKAAVISRHLRQTVSPRLFGRLGERQVRKWINTEKTGWKTTVLEKVTRQEVLAHVQAGLITMPSGSGTVNVSDSSLSAFGDRARKRVAGGSPTKPPRKISPPPPPPPEKEKIDLIRDALEGRDRAKHEHPEGKRKRRKIADVRGDELRADMQSHVADGPSAHLALDPALL